MEIGGQTCTNTVNHCYIQWIARSCVFRVRLDPHHFGADLFFYRLAMASDEPPKEDVKNVEYYRANTLANTIKLLSSPFRSKLLSMSCNAISMRFV